MILLHVEASPKGDHSYSSRLATSFLDEYKLKNPDDEIRTLNVFERDLPEFGKIEALAKFAPIMGEVRNSEQEEAWARIKEEIRFFDEADKILLSCPMWNYSVPWRLKQYIDCLVQPIETFGYDFEKMDHVGLLRNRPLQFILTRSSTMAGDYSDFQLPYLKFIFGAIGIRDLRVITASNTTQASRENTEAYLTKFDGDAKEAAQRF
ncbi:FMN-dependent NADH-azoreductase 1 [Zhongshania aliphaticivorans]|uniref:FMN dependent NADH:quinone oxidoreductase n=1 Tax=Zhongshania aliphaticivorans TaxID=1470434 RepID=A0A5S9NRC8_9GAMM|nr:NAD(P)H-dependent oxidoreductase [Zhongshania aliphaticivorans]CAA0093064.1 FMN-dependent NADH-azoreductase 1 [Zhongshania aliphaticivorans]CAA0110809.1 FMN-dependent NADH-azoreductase 1 [Zhongshania aliphaticivorans]